MTSAVCANAIGVRDALRMHWSTQCTIVFTILWGEVQSESVNGNLISAVDEGVRSCMDTPWPDYWGCYIRV